VFVSARVVRVGDLGRAMTPLRPSGVVELVHGGRLDARAECEAIPAGAAVVVLRGDPTGYVVRAVGPDQPFPALPDDGAEIVRPEFMRNSAEVRRADARNAEEVRRAWAQAGRRRGQFALLLGAAAGIGNTALAHGIDRDTLVRGALIGLLTGTVAALIVGRLGRFLRWSPFAAGAAILGSLFGAEVGFWAQGGPTELRPLALGLCVGALAGLAAGGWVGRKLDVLGGPDVG